MKATYLEILVFGRVQNTDATNVEFGCVTELQVQESRGT